MFDNLTDEQRARLEKLKPIRIILQLTKAANGSPIIVGRTEESFSMGWDDRRANIFWSIDNLAPSLGGDKGQFKMDGIKWAEQNADKHDRTQMIFDPFADDCPVEIDWHAWLTAKQKFEVRNAPFRSKPHGLWQMRALVAEAQHAVSAKELEKYREYYLEADDKLERISSIINDPNED